MALIDKLTLKNFRGFRNKTSIGLKQSSYLVGINNVGKTNILHAIKAFFQDTYFSDEMFLNKTEYLGKKGGYNQSEISLSFNLQELTTRVRKGKLIRSYGDNVEIKKIATFAPTSQTISIKWIINDEEFDSNALPRDIIWLLSSVRVTYIHPQEGQNLFDNVQRRLRDRLLQNWGRNSTLTHQIQDLEASWSEMKKEANKYLSKSLSDSLQEFWPGCKVLVDLPKRVSDIIAVSDINFQGDNILPEIQLTSQGTGAQSTILYLAQYLLDSDRSLNKGEYHPLWLMEEPESFLHADLLFKIARQLNSDAWLNNIQMVISTHSPVLLASSKIVGERVVWNILKGPDNCELVDPLTASIEAIEKIGNLMGDSNFATYFISSQNDKLIFIEDSRPETRLVFEKVGIPVTDGRAGSSEIGRYLDVFAATPGLLKTSAYFILDSDKGKKSIERHLKKSKLVFEENGFKKLSFEHIPNVYIILLRDGETVEDMFSEYDNHVRDCVDLIYDKNFRLREHCPMKLSMAAGCARRHPQSDIAGAIQLIKNEQDVKDFFWEKIKKSNLSFKRDDTLAIKKLLGA